MVSNDQNALKKDVISTLFGTLLENKNHSRSSRTQKSSPEVTKTEGSLNGRSSYWLYY